jgi:calreticulin
MIALSLLLASATATVYFSEEFNDGWESRWVQSMWKDEMSGQFVSSAGAWFVDANIDKGI